jgi:glycosyltransferase involved in cell wall biosynthesis
MSRVERFRALVVAYDFPPHGAIGTMRTLRAVRQLHADGWDVTVLTSSPATYLPGTPIEARLLDDVPPGVRVIRARAFRGLDALTRAVRGGPGRAADAPASGTSARVRAARPGRMRRAKDLVDAALSIPDNDSGWILPAIVQGVRHVAAHGAPDVIYSSAPPWSGQAVALALARMTRRPWVADFRDPWSRAPWRDWRRPFRQRSAAALERRVVARSNAVLFVTRANLDDFAAFYGPAAASRFHLVPNGCDPREFEGVTPRPARPEFVLLHAGTLYGARNPLPLIQAIARGIGRGAIDRARFRLRLLGGLNLAVDLPAACRRLGVEDVVEIVPRVSRHESLREMRSASALLLVQPGTTVSVPGKAYEYLAAGRPVMALAEEGETAELVRASGAGVSVRPDASVEAIEEGLLTLIGMARDYTPPDLKHYDGWVHAAATTALLARMVLSHREGRPVDASAMAAPSPTALRPEEPRR